MAFMEALITDDLTALLRTMISTQGDMMQNLVQEEANAVTPFVRERTPIGKHFDFGGTTQSGGDLRESLHFVVGKWGAYLAGLEYGKFVITGTAPHLIEPRSARALAFFWPKMGQSVMFARVHHPGTRPNDFRQEGLQEAFDSNVVTDVATQVFMSWGRT